MSTRRLLTRSLLVLLLLAVTAAAEETQPRSVRLSFVPPPLEGTISLGIYDGTGKLVRVLHREAEFEAFEIGPDALITSWDGKDDAGEALPPGNYNARGYAVGNVQVEGVGFFLNDWVKDEQSPRIQRIENIALQNGDALLLLVQLADGSTTVLPCNADGEIASDWKTPPAGVDFYDFVSPARRNLRVKDGVLTLNVNGSEEAVKWPQLHAPQDAGYGRGETVWVIDKPAAPGAPVEVKQFSTGGEFLRRLSIAADEPQPRAIAASRSSDRIYLLEEKPGVVRLRALTLQATKSEADQPVSDWKVEFEKSIVQHEHFTIENGKPVPAAQPPAPATPLPVKLPPNPLEGGKRGKLELLVGHDRNGSYLKTADGLPLQTISETPLLKQVLLTASGEKSADVFQSDAAVVEQFRVSNLDQLMAFDCGRFELK